jgi:hypothetical protein
MLLKEKDSPEQAIQELEAIARQLGLPKGMLAKVEKEQKTLKAGHRGEFDSAYHIDFTTARSLTGPSFMICVTSMATMLRRLITRPIRFDCGGL